MKINPTKIMDKLDTINDAWQDLAPTDPFAEMTAAEFDAEIQKSVAVRKEILDFENKLKEKLMERDVIDAANWELSQYVVSSVAGSRKYGKNSALYQRMGYVATSERRSGLTRKRVSGVALSK
jgi:hypothetical protein